ncbi:MAG: hypothetical protein ABI425_04405 [Patescibacteria group bacterium]
MTPQDYLHQLLVQSSQHDITANEQQFLESRGLEDFIYSKLTSKKFRKSKMEGDCVTRTKEAIRLRIEKKEPISIVYPQGGYKLWRFPSSPTVDWAEFFNISYLVEYIAPIAKMYEHGVQITYYMHTLLMELHDNLTTEEIQAYVDSFDHLLIGISKYLPKNITISILRDADLYSRDEYFTALEEGKSLAEKEYNSLPKIKTDDLARMANLNIKWDGKEDWTKLTQAQKNEKVYLAALYEMAATSQLKRVGEKVKSPDNVLVFTKAAKDFIGIGSTKASIAKYWVGFGVLQRKGDSFLPVILTPSQYEQAKKLDHTTVVVDLIQSQNFKEILVFDKPFLFTNITKK